MISDVMLEITSLLLCLKITDYFKISVSSRDPEQTLLRKITKGDKGKGILTKGEKTD